MIYIGVAKTILLTLLLFLSAGLSGQDFQTVPSTVVCTDSENFVMLAELDQQPKVFTESRSTVLTKPVTISAEYKAYANLLFSSGLKVRLEEESRLTVWTAEQDVAIEAGESTQVEGDDIGIVLNVKLEKGQVWFHLPIQPNRVSTFTVQTDHAEIEVHSTSFSVEIATFGFTKVRCNDGYLLVTMKNGKVERIENEEVSIHGENGANETMLRPVQTPEAVYTWPTDTLPRFHYDDKTKTFIVQST